MKKVIEYLETIVDNGAETLVKDYALLLDKEKINVYILVNYITPNSANYRIIKESKIPVYSIYKNYTLVTKVFNKLIGKFYIKYKLKKIIREIHPDVIHINSRLLRYINSVKNKLDNINIFYTCHSVPSVVFNKKNKAECNAAKEMAKYSSFRFIALHNDMKEELNKFFGRNDTIVIRNGIDFNRFNKKIYSKNSERKRLQIPEDMKVIGHVGRMSVVKNQSFLIDIFDKLYKENNKIMLLLVGSGELEEEIKNKIKMLNIEKNVMILSHRNDIPEILSTMDVFVFPSLYEGIPVSLIEAQIMGLKCICSDKINKEAIISDNVLMLDINSNKEIWADAIKNCNNIKNSKYVEMDEYNMRNVINDLEKIYLKA